MALDTTKLADAMIKAARGVLQQQWPQVRAYAEAECRKLAQHLQDTTTMLLKGEINEQEARLLLDMQHNTARTVLLTVQGLGLLAAEAAINAALDAVKTAVNTAAGIALL